MVSDVASAYLQISERLAIDTRVETAWKFWTVPGTVQLRLGLQLMPFSPWRWTFVICLISQSVVSPVALALDGLVIPFF